MSTQQKERYVPPKGETSVTTANTTSANLRNINGSSVLIGRLPEDFLRFDGIDGSIDVSGRNQIDCDKELAASLQQQYDQQSARRRAQWSQFQAHLTVTFVEARLVKNYGLMNMNPYVRFRIGHTIFETKTSYKGGKNPKWNESFRCHLEKGLDHLSIELFDECFLNDELIAWTSYKIPERFCQPQGPVPTETYEEVIPLTGKQGDGKEGDIFMVFTFKPISAAPIAPTVYPVGMHPIPASIHGAPYIFGGTSTVMNPPVLVHQTMQPASSLLQPQPPQPPAAQSAAQPPAPVKIKEEDLKSLQEMFPSIEPDLINSVLLSERGNLERAINNLLELSTTT